MIKQIASKVLLVVSYLWVALLDVIVMLAVCSMISRIATVFGASDTIAFLIGGVGAILSFLHLKFRYQMRHFGKPTAQCMYCGTNKGCKEVCQPCLEICSGGDNTSEPKDV